MSEKKSLADLAVSCISVDVCSWRPADRVPRTRALQRRAGSAAEPRRQTWIVPRITRRIDPSEVEGFCLKEKRNLPFRFICKCTCLYIVMCCVSDFVGSVKMY